ncbi:hypothetical protein B0J14DRAFT_601778 [Halenospora varia]|nr:hypothetical protein B0J14DRAFT_601778 [Halenospora varia]
MYTPNDMLSGNQSQNEPVSLDAFNNYMNIKQQYYNSGSQSYEPPTFSTGVTTTSNMRAFPGVYTPYQQPPPLQQPRQPLQQLSPAAPCGRRMDFSFAERNVSRPQTYMRGGGSHFSKPARNEESRQKQPKEASNRSSASIPALRRVPKPPPKDPTREPLTAVHTKPLDRKQRERMGSWNWNDAVDGKGEERGGGESPRGESFSE